MDFSQKQIDTFWSRVMILGDDECWPWMRGKSSGYGIFHANNNVYKSHRLAYELSGKVIPSGLVLDHTCHNNSDCKGGAGCLHRACCNPRHGEPVTHSENVTRGRAGINFINRAHCPQGHEYDASNTGTQKHAGKQKVKGRFCRKCNQERMANARAKRRGEPSPYPEQTNAAEPRR